MTDPNFMVIGAQKSGTSWLAKMMRQHPDIYAPERKELHFFNLQSNYQKGISWYRQQFAGHTGQKAIGEFTPNYLWICPNQQEIDEIGVIANIPEIIHSYFPTLKLIVTLRDPVQRAVSAYYHFLRARSFAPHRSIVDVGHTNGILTMGYYQKHLQAWMQYFAPEQFLFLTYEEDIVANKSATLARLFRFLEVDPTFVPQNMNSQYNARAGHTYLYLNYYLPKLAPKMTRVASFLKRVNVPKIRVKSDELSWLRQLYQKENEQLEQVIGFKPRWSIFA